MKSAVILLLIGVVVLPRSALATDVAGDQWGVWRLEDSPFIVVGEIRVPPESTLVIEPGVFVYFKGHYKFIVDSLATLLAVGTQNDSIYFTVDDTTIRWDGMGFDYADNNSQVSYCRLEYGEHYAEPDHGGAIYCYESSPTITNNNIRWNSASQYGSGGGIFCWRSNPTIANNTITANGAIYGGAIGCSFSAPIIRDNVIERNSAYFLGGGIRCYYSDPLILDNTITNNRAYLLSGGGISCESSNPTIEGNIISDNSVAERGGGIHLHSSSPTISNNIISGNASANGLGGGICCWWHSNPHISNNIIDGNWTFWYGGGIYCNSSNATICNNVITSNVAYYNGGGICCWHSDLVIMNTILWGDTAPENPEIYLEAGNLLVTYCDVQGGWEGEGNIDLDPLFRNPPADNFHLMADYCGDPYNSPCIDVGHPDSLDALLDCFHGLGTDRCDMGAYGGRNSGWPTGIDDDGDSNPIIPKQFLLHQNYPNPFNATTLINYQLTTPTYVKLEIFNLFGQRLATLVDFRQQGGNRSVIWDATGFASGIYFYRMTAGEYTFTRKMVLSK